ncbi:hypothetical protein KOR42_22820 [Thalassoglobus neptunius]|uniref:Phage portal protein, lambda family n=1 Tax=Thalassoglobus neptunius TaxID=1938619 RepID=A0A5C5X9Q3_9PLAN|nr:hypothetical protein KOR42_22820 [Thalassoglobus neptunius]
MTLHSHQDAILEKRDQLREALGGGGAVTDPLDYLTPTWGGVDWRGESSGWGRASTNLMYQGGDFRPFWYTWMMHSIHREECRMVATVASMASAVKDRLEDYVIAGGFSYEVKSKERGNRRYDALIDQLQADMEEFMDRNGWAEGGLESDLHNGSREDGEAFLALSPGKHGVDARIIEPEYCCEGEHVGRDVDNKLGLKGTSWRYGVQNLESDVTKPLGYLVDWSESQTDYQYFMAENAAKARFHHVAMAHHIKRNVRQPVKRGMSDFFNVAPQIVQDAKLIRNMVHGASNQAAIAWIEKYVEASQQQMAVEVGKLADHKRNMKSSGGGLREESGRTVRPGTVLSVTKGKDYVPGPMGSDRNAGFEIVSSLAARRIGAKWAMPEFMISGDASNNNLASAQVAEGPFTRAREKDQRFYSKHFREILWKMFDIYCAQGRYQRYGIDSEKGLSQLKQIVLIDIETPEVAQRDRKEDAEAKEIMHDSGVLSADTWARQAELDPDIEDENLRTEGKQLGVASPLTEREQHVAQYAQKTMWDFWDQQAKDYP